MLLEGPLDDLMVKVSPKIYRKYAIMVRKGKPLIYVKIQKAVYGLLLSTLLLHRKLVKDIEVYGFQINS